jgi:tetratricopeptide (TPR) repeat protein
MKILEAQIMDTFNQMLPTNCVEKGQLYSHIGAVHCQQGTYDAALFNLKKALDIQQKRLAPDQGDICETYQRFADCFEGKKQIDKALEYDTKCLRIRLDTLTENHPAIASTYNNLGSLYENKRNYAEACEYYRKSLDISYKTLPPTHPELRRTENNMKRVRNLLEERSNI